MKTRIFALIADKQKGLDHIITKTEIVKETELTKPTIERWLSGDVTRFDEDTLIALCRYLGCEVGQLLYIDWDEANKKKRNGKKPRNGDK